MSDSSNTAVLAVDGGGTLCRFAYLAGPERRIALGGPANVFSDFEGSIRCIIVGLNALAEVAGKSMETLVQIPAFVGLAGVSGPAAQARLKAAIPLTDAVYADDRHSALCGALGTEDGFVVHCGTGSFLASQIGGRVRLVGGWGADLGDEASAQWVGRKALQRTLRQQDGTDDGSSLTETLVREFAGSDGILRFASQATPETYGALAPRVTECARNGDAVAVEILASGAAYLADTLARMGWEPGHTICLTGGIGPHYAQYLPSDMRRALRDPKGSPLDGALQLALAHAKENSDGHS